MYFLKIHIQNAERTVDPDQTAPKEQSDLGLHCLLTIYVIYLAIRWGFPLSRMTTNN